MKAIKKNICIEEFISRIPGLFPYIEIDEFGAVIKHKATDSVDGCYGKMIPDIIFDGETIPYRTLMRKYYSGDVTVSDFVERAIGKFCVEDFTDFTFEEGATLVPEFIYAAEAKSLLDEMYKLRDACKMYSSSAYRLCCDCEKFDKMGGETMINLLLYLIDYAETVAVELLESSTSDASYGFNVNLSGSYEDMGYFTPYITEDTQLHNVRLTTGDISKRDYDNLELSEKANYDVYHLSKACDKKYLPLEEGDYVTDSAYLSLSDEEKEKYEENVTIFSNVAKPITMTADTDSKLKSLRCFTTYINTREQYEEPESGEDWLYFYQRGYVANYDTVNDENGNIMTIGDAPKEKDGDYVTNLLAYGSLITDIVCDTDKKTITFTYYINAHLKAKLASDDNSNVDEYKYPFEYESGGVKQTETYYYTVGGELDTLVNNGDFEKYISLTYEGNDNVVYGNTRKFEIRKCAFTTIGSDMSYEKTIWDRSVEIPYQYSRLEYTRNNEFEVYNADIFKEDYLIGVHFKPEVDSKVNIRRGNNAAFERHIRLGEVKTLEDMENYMNGSFFNIQQIV